MRKYLLFPCLLISQTLLADGAIWTDANQHIQSRRLSVNTTATPEHHRLLRLNLEKLTELLTTESFEQHLTMPLPDGQLMMFKVEPSETMAPELAARYPEIRTWKITNPDNPSISGRIDLTPNGFHGQINTDTGERILIDPAGDLYASRNSSVSQEKDSAFHCQQHSESLISHKSPLTENSQKLLSRAADSIRTYRIAIATTGEYTQLFGGSKSASLAAVVTTLNRVNQVFERDLSIRLELVENNDQIIYASPSSDPYTNEDATAMVDENIVNINAVIGKENYDIGHVFGTGSTGGIAFLSSACGTYKAGGVTGSNSPIGDAFYIDYVSHEIGHQLGASHTFNGYQLNCRAGNRSAATAVEPGSGSSIMGYAGICGTDNLQANSDAFFHSVSIEQIKSYTQNSSGSTCGAISSRNNNNPIVSAGLDYTIPAETPFVLTGTSSDSDADSILHSWEQVDTGTVGGLYTDIGDNPLFRTWPPVSDTTRFFPKLTDTLKRTQTIGELLPSTDRKMNFTLLTRDNKGGLAQDNMALNVVNTGKAFSVLSQRLATTLSPNQAITVSWDVANTSLPPISCSHVNIGFITNSGDTTSLVSNTLNDGTHDLVIPGNIARIQNAHIQVSCSNNVFFAVSEGEINVLEGTQTTSASTPINTPQFNYESIEIASAGAEDAPIATSIESPPTSDPTPTKGGGSFSLFVVLGLLLLPLRRRANLGIK